MKTSLSMSTLTRKILSGLSVLGVVGAVSVGTILGTTVSSVNTMEANAAASPTFVSACTAAGGTASPNGIRPRVCTFNYTGSPQVLSVPAGTYKLEVWGSRGGGTVYGYGGYARGEFTATSDTALYVYVGTYNNTMGKGGGYNGGGGTVFGNDFGGGGATDIRTTISRGDRLIVGGGGGGGRVTGGTGGLPHGGGLSGRSGPGGLSPGGTHYPAAGGGTQNYGGAVGTMVTNSGQTGGSLGQGGTGYYGGGGGVHWSGGGGSSYVGNLENADTATGVNNAGGYATITELTTPPTLTTSTATILNNSTSNTGSSASTVLNWNPGTAESVQYTWTLSNTDGNYASTINAPSVTWPAGWSCSWNAQPTSVAANSTATFTATCSIPRANYPSTTVNTTAISGPTLTLTGTQNSSTWTTSLAPDALTQENMRSSASLATTASMGSPDNGAVGQVGLGDQVRYDTTVTNNGTNTLNGINVTSPLFEAHDDTVTNCAPVNITPGQISTCTTTFTANAADVAGSQLSNTVTVRATPSYLADTNFTEVSLGSANANSLTVETAKFTLSAPTVAAVLTDEAPTGGNRSAGDRVRFSTTLTNTGSTQLRNFSVTDSLGNTYTCSPTILNASASATCTADYTLTVADTASTPITLNLSGSAQVSSCSTETCPVVSTTAESTLLVQVYAPNHAITTRTAAISPDAYTVGTVNSGDKVNYSITVLNSGNAPWTGFAVTDARGLTYSCGASTLAIGASATCTASITADSSNITGTTFAWDPTLTYQPAYGGDEVTVNLGSTSLPSIVPVKSLSLTITARKASDNTVVPSGGSVSKGTSVNFSYLVRNTGNINVAIPASGLTTNDGITVTCVPATLAPNSTTTCSGSKVLD